MMDESNDEIEADEAADDSIKLLDFPNEILLRMLQHFTDTHLLDMTRVCTRFEALASETFAQRYTGASDDRYFKTFCNSHGDEAIYQPIFEAFGQKMTALEIVMESTAKFNQDYWLYKFIRKHCTSSSITHVIVKYANLSFNYQQFLDSLSAITHLMFVSPHYNRWVDYRFERVINFRVQSFQPIRASAVQRFVQHNSQLQRLELNGTFMNDPLIELSGKLNSLEWLTLNGRCMEPSYLTEVTFEQLKSLTISLDHYSAANVLQAIEQGCNHIEYLDITTYGEVKQRFEDQHDDYTTFINREKAQQIRHFTKLVCAISTFNQLKSLRLTGLSLLSDSLEILAEHSPKSLTVLRLSVQKVSYNFERNDILYIFKALENFETFSLTNLDQKEGGYCTFGLDWCREFAAIGANRKQSIRCEYNGKDTKIVATKDKFIINGVLQYWAGYEPDHSQSKTRIIDLNEKCIDQILEWLPDYEVSSVYQTCTALKKIAAKRIQSERHHFGVCDIQSFEDWLDIIEDDIRKLVIWIDEDYPEEHNGSSEILTLVRDRCSKNLTEFQINHGNTSLMDDLNLSFPNLEKLTIDHVVTSNGKFLPAIIPCSKLKYLDIGTYEINTDDDNVELAIPDFHLGISIENLTVLKLQYFDNVIAHLFSTLSDKICLQLTEFTAAEVDNIAQNGNRLINMVCRFRNLTELNLVFPGLERTNTVHLFERCSKLVKLSLSCGQFDVKMQRVLQNCKKHCNDLKIIHLVCQIHSADEEMCHFISNRFPNVELYKVMIREANERRKYKIVLWNKSSIPKDCERPY